MRRPWFKLWTEKMLTADFFMLSERARATLLHALVLSSRTEGKPMVAGDLQVLSAIPIAKQELALKELEARGFVAPVDGGYAVPMYTEMQEKIDHTRADRIARWREKKRSVTPNVTPGVTPDVTPKSVTVTEARGTEEQRDRAPTETSSPPVLPLRPDKRTAAERAADEALGLLRPRVEPVLTGMTWTAWKQRNRQIVVDMVRAGMSAADVDRAHQAHSEAKGRVAVVMRYVQEWVASQNAVPERQYELLTVPTRPE